jgi:Uma2 family endonuclease
MAIRSPAREVSVERYLSLSYSPDHDYVDGRVEERNLGEYDHATCQGNMFFWLRAHDKEWNMRTVPEIRVRVSAIRYRVPDVCVLNRELPIERIITHPPLICIEVLSPDDRLGRLHERLHDYWQLGVRNIWVIDPQDKSTYVFAENGLQEVRSDRFSVPGTPIYLPLDEVFADLS